MSKEYQWTVGLNLRIICIRLVAMTVNGDALGNCSFQYGCVRVLVMAEWFLQLTGAEPRQVEVGVEVLRGPVIEMLLRLGEYRK